MKKQNKLLIILLFSIYLVSMSQVNAAIVIIDGGGFGIEVEVAPGVGNTVASGTFGITVYIEYYEWGDWCPVWRIGHAPGDFTYPSNFIASHMNATHINLTWTQNVNATHTYIVRNINSTATSRENGTLVCNTTNTWYDDTGLNQGTHYYYSAWLYNSSLDMFSPGYVSDDNCTSPGNPSNLQDTGRSMTSISLTWDKGVNVTNTVIRYSDYDYPLTPAVNESGYNNTGSSTTMGGLAANTTYYFRAWSWNSDCGFISDGNTTVNVTTVSSAGVPTSFIATTIDETRIDLSWTKGDEYTVIIRKTGSLPTGITDGTTAYNGTLSSYSDTSLGSAVHYYYRAWGWNGFEYSIGTANDDNVTLPEPPDNFMGLLDETTLAITWDKPASATRTVIRNATGSYPSTPQDGFLVYNDTGEVKTVYNVGAFEYFRGWSYALIDGISVFSTYVNLIYGGLEINVYKETDPSILISNYTVFITNQEGSETYENATCNNPTRIDVADVPNGADITVQVSKTGYHPRVQIMDLYENQWYAVNFYLARDEDEDLPPADQGGDEDVANETEGKLYEITVVGPLGEFTSPPIEEARVIIKRYINTTEEFDIISTRYTDANGHIYVYLIPNTIYKLVISKEDPCYDTEIADFIPSDSVFVAEFRLYPCEREPSEYDSFWEVITFTSRIRDAGCGEPGNMTIVYNDRNEGTINTTILLYEFYQGVNTLIDTNINSEGNNSVSYVVSGINTSRAHIATLHFNNTATFEITSPVSITIYAIHSWPCHSFDIDVRMKSIFGPFTMNRQVVSWAVSISIVFAILMLTTFGVFNTGIGIIASGLALGFTQAAFGVVGFTNNFNPLLASLSPVIIAIGVIYFWTKGKPAEDHL